MHGFISNIAWMIGLRTRTRDQLRSDLHAIDPAFSFPAYHSRNIAPILAQSLHSTRIRTRSRRNLFPGGLLIEPPEWTKIQTSPFLLHQYTLHNTYIAFIKRNSSPLTLLRETTTGVLNGSPVRYICHVTLSHQFEGMGKSFSRTENSLINSISVYSNTFTVHSNLQDLLSSATNH